MFRSNSTARTIETGKEIAAGLKPGSVIALSGPLGAGKTTVVKGIAIGLSITEPVTSPTFNLIQEYHGCLPLYHIDLYRIRDTRELVELGLEEYIFSDGVTVIEWPEIASDFLPEETIHLSITVNGDGGREFSVTEKA